MEYPLQALLPKLLFLPCVHHDEGIPSDTRNRTSMEARNLLCGWIAGAGTDCDRCAGGGIPLDLVLGGKTFTDCYFRYKMLTNNDSSAGLSLSSLNRSAYYHSYYSCAKPPFQQ